MQIKTFIIFGLLLSELAFAQPMCSIYFETKSNASITSVFTILKTKKKDALRENQISFLNDYLKSNNTSMDKSKIVAVILRAINDPTVSSQLSFFNIMAINYVSRKQYSHEISITQAQEQALFENLQPLIYAFRIKQLQANEAISRATRTLEVIAEKGKITLNELESLHFDTQKLVTNSSELVYEAKVRSELMNNRQLSQSISDRINSLTKQLDRANSSLSEKDQRLFKDIYEDFESIYMKIYTEI